MAPDTLVFIGRFQPFHRAHLATVEAALDRADQLIILVGSVYRARDSKNPFTFAEREQMIRDVLAEKEASWLDRIVILPLADRMYDEAAWCSDVRQLVVQHATGERIAMIGHEKDASTYYLRLFPEWPWVSLPAFGSVSATAIRAVYFDRDRYMADPSVAGQLPDSTVQFLIAFMTTSEYDDLVAGFQALLAHRDSWHGTPYPVIFVTVDAFVRAGDRILLIQRGRHPGKGLWAMPGGYLEPHEPVRKGIIRELMEETSIDLSADVLNQHMQQVAVYDHPERSLLGRVVTHVGVIILSDDNVAIQAADDAAAAAWWLIDEIHDRRDQFHDDHYYIMAHLLR